MNLLDELKINVQGLSYAVEDGKKFFAPIFHYVKQLEKCVNLPAEKASKDELVLLAAKIEEFFVRYRPSGTPGVLYIPPAEASGNDLTAQQIKGIVNQMAKLSNDQFLALFPRESTGKVEEDSKTKTEGVCVFIGHGRSKLWSRVNTYLRDELNIATVYYEKEPRTGESIVPILEKMLDQSTFAVLVLTAEDETAGGTVRARQNVIHEAGLFQGRLGFKRAVLLVQKGIEEFTNVDGLQYLPFADSEIEQTFYELQRTLKREKQI
jgi:predicted nucleotide-binding protein